MATAKKLNREQQAIAGLFVEFSRVSAEEGIGPCTLAEMIVEYAKHEEGVTSSFLGHVIAAASSRAEADYAERRAKEA